MSLPETPTSANLQTSKIRSVKDGLGDVVRRIAAEKAVLWSLLIKFGSAFLLLATSVVLARTLGIDQFGIYSFALALIAVLQLPATAGTFTLVLRDTAKGLARSEHAQVKGLWKWNMKVVITLSLAVCVISWLVMALMGAELGDPRSQTIFLALVAVPFIAVSRQISARLRGLKMVIFSQIPEQIISPALLLITVGIAAVILPVLTSTHTIALYLACAILALIILACVFHFKQPPELQGSHADISRSIAWRRSLIGLSLLSGLQLLTPQVAVIGLGATGQLEAVAEIKLATSITVFGIFVVQVINFVYGPQVSQSHALDDRQRIQSLAGRAVAMGALGAIPILLALAVCASPIVRMVYGEQYTGAVTPVQILAGAYAVRTLFGPCGVFLTMTGNQRSAIRGHLVGLAILFLLMLLLVPSTGATGAAIAVAAALMLTQMHMHFNLKRLTSIDSSLWAAFLHYKRFSR